MGTIREQLEQREREILAPQAAKSADSRGRLRTEAEGALVLMCSHEEKAALLATGDPAFFTTPHYDGYGAILVDLERVEMRQLAELVEESWRVKAPVKLRKAFDAERG